MYLKWAPILYYCHKTPTDETDKDTRLSTRDQPINTRNLVSWRISLKLLAPDSPSHFKAKMHQIRFLAFVRLSVCSFVRSFVSVLDGVWHLLVIYLWMLLTDRLPAEPLHTHRSAAKDPSLHFSPATSVSNALRIRLRTDSVPENGVSRSTSRHASN